MESIKREKRHCSIFVPYFEKNGEFFVFLQKCEKNAERLPDYFGFWGGGIDGDETPEQGLLREVREEMDYIPVGYFYFGRYDFKGSVKNVFVLKIDDASKFEKSIKIFEGEYGKWFNEEEVERELKLIEEDKVIIRDLFKMLQKGKIR